MGAFTLSIFIYSQQLTPKNEEEANFKSFGFLNMIKKIMTD